VIRPELVQHKAERKPTPVVPHPDDMTDDTFVKHFNRRHSDHLGGLAALDLDHLTPYVLGCYRSFHNQLHGILRRAELDHEHAE
jgi:hypothetical protein